MAAHFALDTAESHFSLVLFLLFSATTSHKFSDVSEPTFTKFCHIATKRGYSYKKFPLKSP